MSNIIRLPGLIDIHVHLRDPGQTHKEDFYTGTSAALAGGVTVVFDMPNNLEPVFTYEKLLEKMKTASQKAVCDWGLYFGTDGRNTDQFERVQQLVVGLKIYLNLTTGKYVVEDERLVEQVFKNWPKDKVIVVHAEGEKIDLAIALCRKYSNKMHITHIATKSDLEKIIDAKLLKQNITCDVTPHNLFFFKDQKKNIVYSTLGREKIEYNLLKMIVVKPSIATRRDVEYIWEHLKYVDCIATDHAPHTKNEKKSFNPPTGIPGLETMLPLLLTQVAKKRITVPEIIRLTNTGPRQIFNLDYSENTYIEVDIDEKYTIENNKLFTKCGWSPFDGWEVCGKVKRVVLRGVKVFEKGKVLIKPGFGQNIIHHNYAYAKS